MALKSLIDVPYSFDFFLLLLFGNLLYSVGLFYLSKSDYLRTSEVWTRLTYDLCILLKHLLTKQGLSISTQ